VPGPRVAVIVPTFQRAARLPLLVAALEAQTFPRGAFEVVISDDCSTDQTSQVLEQLVARSPLNLRVVRTEHNSGPARARNIAWRSTDAPLLAFFDDDCTPSPRWLEAGVSPFSEADVGIVQGRTIPDPSSPLEPYNTIGYKTVTQNIERLNDRYEACNIFYRRDVLEAVGGFDETIYFFGEDTATAWAVLRLGAGARFAGDSLVHHEVTTRGMRWYVRWALLHRNWPLLIRRFPEKRKTLWCRFFVAPRHAALLSAIVGLTAGIMWFPAFVLTVPFLSRYVPWSLRRDEIVGRATEVVYDILVIGAIVAGSIRERTPML
jgi:glycosyltransferase involved in cell wall biosynthesis